jgi:signal peptidase I
VTDPSPAASDEKKESLPVWQESLLLLAIALVLAIGIKYFFVQAFYIPSPSMEPMFIKNDRILVQKVSYWGDKSPHRGDIIVFKDPGNWLNEDETRTASNPITKTLEAVGLYPSGGHLVKRVIGVAGDRIHCCDDQGRISVNGQSLDEKSYARLDGAECYGPMVDNCDWTSEPVPEGSIFVMGDNRFHSADSTVHMCREDQTECVPGDEFVPVDLVVGKVFVLLWPRSHFRWVHRPDTFADVPDAPE